MLSFLEELTLLDFFEGFLIEDCENKKIIFESGAILIYLAEKYKKYLPKNKYWEVLQWVILQVAYVGPMLGQAHQYLYYNSGKSKFAEKKSRQYTKHVYEICWQILNSRYCNLAMGR